MGEKFTKLWEESKREYRKRTPHHDLYRRTAVENLDKEIQLFLKKLDQEADK